MSGKKKRMFRFGVFMLLNALHNPVLFAGDSVENSITIVYNNVPGDATAGVQVGGGFSAFIVFNQKTILFDVGGDANILVNNLKALGLDAVPLDAIMISHNHFDHLYGLPGVAYRERPPRVYVPGSCREAILAQNPGADIIPVDEPMQIFPDVWSTGPIATNYNDVTLSEQALIIDGDEALYVVTGCAHPGIVSVIERVRQLFPEEPIALVTGGFHLINATNQEVLDMSAKLKQSGVKKLAPSHCTGRLAMEIFKEEWGEHYLRLYLGHAYHF